ARRGPPAGQHPARDPARATFRCGHGERCRARARAKVARSDTRLRGRRPGRPGGVAGPGLTGYASVATMSKLGYFGPFGGRFVAETLIPALEELDRAYQQIVPSPAFQAEWRGLLDHYVGRPTPLTAAPRLARALDADGAC